MNKERMLKLADELERGEELKARGVRFNMLDFIGNDERSSVAPHFQCGTTACIGGSACILFGESGSHIGESEAAGLLDLNYSQSYRLFYDGNGYISGDSSLASLTLGNISATDAVAAIRRMVKEEGNA